MQRQVLRAGPAKRIGPRIVPDIGAIPSGFAQPKAVRMGRRPNLEHKNQLVFGPIEGPHPGIGLVPDAEVLEFREHVLPGCEQLGHMAPVHTHKGNRTILGHPRGRAEGLFQESDESFHAHLTRGAGEFPVPGLAQTAHMALNGHVIGRVGEDQVNSLSFRQPRNIRGAARVPAQQPVRAQMPQISRTRHSRPRSGRGQRVSLAAVRARAVFQNQIDLRQGKARQVQTEFNVQQPLKFEPGSQDPNRRSPPACCPPGCRRAALPPTNAPALDTGLPTSRADAPQPPGHARQ